MKYTEGEQVLAKHPLLLGYHRGTVLDVKGDRYVIKFDTGGEHMVNEDDVQYQRVSRSTARTSSRVPKKSPSRDSPNRKSPSRRSPSRRSPSRRSPSRRSPGRSPTTTSSRKLPVRNTRFAKISLSRIDHEESNHKNETSAQTSDKSIEMIPLQQRLNEINMESTQRYRANRAFSDVKSEPEHKMEQLTRNLDRAVSLPLERKTFMHNCLPEEKERGFSMQRDQDLKRPSRENEKWEEVVKREKEISKVDKPQEWGGWIGTSLFTLVLPLSLILPQLSCSEEQCEFTNVTLPIDLESYVDLRGLLSYVLFLVLLAGISIVPIGRIVDGLQSKIGRLQYRINGFLSVLLTIIAFIVCVHKDIRIDDYILSNIVRLSVSGWILGTILAFGLYIKAERAPIANLNIYASTNSKIYNFWQGREINPRIGTLDIKLLLIRTSAVGTLLLHLAILTKIINSMESSNIEQLNGAAILVVSLQCWYIMDRFINEAAILTSFEIMYEGTGYMMCVSHLLRPFLMSLTTRFVLYQRVRLSYFAGIFVLSFVMGYALYRISNSCKNNFRRNPVASALSRLETISTSRGKKLMLSGLWGYVRHPNYLGDITIHWSIAAVTLASDILPYYAAIWFTLMLAYRAVRDNRRCQARYGYAWERYCSRVNYMILKHVF